MTRPTPAHDRAPPGARILVYGNAGSGKSTMARRLSSELAIPHLDLDTLTWDAPLVRRSLSASVAALTAFMDDHPGWVIEGCYGDVVAAAAPRCTELLFLNPGVEACVDNCRARPFEPHKFATREAQDAMLPALIDWVRRYAARDDEYGLACHRRVFDAFPGVKRELAQRRP